ncbi:hypothetical protein DX883_12825 [Vibrio fluvialis]|nr:replication endonuclease [Vibrio fluvialis]EKO3996654.1 hypothetical protein [Vibrio fluvialis]
MMAIESDDGVQIDMTAVAESSQSNPANRRYELMTRIAGCQEYAEANEHIAIAVTMTAPSRFHRLRQNGNHWIENKKYDGSSPKQAQEWLCHTWSRFRAFADRRGFTYYGMRVVEPHQDGTPHWHAVFFMPLDQVGRFNAGLERYMLGKGRDLYELYFDDGKPKSKAMRARFHTQMIDGAAGGAVAYLAKYISKNVDGHALEGVTDSDAHAVKLQEVVKNVTAWSRAFCFRQFQFQRTPSVTVWRELRRIQDKQEWCLFEKARRAADMGFFSAYFDYMGGHRLRQSERPITTYKREKQNKYGEFVTVVKGLEGSGLVVFTHETEWKMVKKDSALAEAEKGSGSDRPWSRGNNCTVPSKGQRIIDNYYLSLELDGFDVAHQEWVKSENVGFGVLEAVGEARSPTDYVRQRE